MCGRNYLDDAEDPGRRVVAGDDQLEVTVDATPPTGRFGKSGRSGAAMTLQHRGP